MPARPRRYRKKPLAAFEHGTRIYGPTANERRYRVVATDPCGARLFHKFASEHDARAKAREIEAYLADRTPIRSSPTAPARWPPWPRVTWPTWAGARSATGSARTPCCGAGSCPAWANRR